MNSNYNEINIEEYSCSIHGYLCKKLDWKCLYEFFSIHNINDNAWKEHCLCLKKKILELIVKTFFSEKEYSYTGELCKWNDIDEFVMSQINDGITNANIMENKDSNVAKIIKLFIVAYLSNPTIVSEKEIYALNVLFNSNFLSTQLDVEVHERYKLEVLNDIKKLLNSVSDRKITETYFTAKLEGMTTHDLEGNYTFSLLYKIATKYGKITNGSMNEIYTHAGSILYSMFDLRNHLPDIA